MLLYMKCFLFAPDWRLPWFFEVTAIEYPLPELQFSVTTPAIEFDSPPVMFILDAMVVASTRIEQSRSTLPEMCSVALSAFDDCACAIPVDASAASTKIVFVIVDILCSN